MKNTLGKGIALALLFSAAAPALAQSGDWSGGYVGVHAGALMDPDDDGDRIEFDTNLDGDFDNNVLTTGGANAFSPGFCDGIPNGPTPGAGCEDNTGGADWGLRGGYDWQSDNWVFGVLAEYSMNDARDAVTAYSTTPASYTMLRKIDGVLALRARVGMAFDDDNLFYVTGGYARANIENYFFTSNGVNTFTSSGDSDASGMQFGVGYERRFSDAFAVGIEYLATRLDDDEARVRSSGPAPATNPFILVNAAGTDFRRSDDNFDLDSVRITATFRF